MAQRNFNNPRVVGILMPQMEMVTRSWSPSAMWQPRTDIYESRDAVLLQIEVPGMEISQLRIHFEAEQLTIEGVRPQPQCSPTHHCLQVESESGAFRRVFALPKNIDGAHIEARLELGVLYVTLPKRAVEERRAMKIEIA